MSVLAFALVAAAAAGHHGPEAAGVRSLDVVTDAGVAHVLTAAKTARGLELQHQRSRDGGRTWSAPVRLPVGTNGLAGAHRGNDPQIAAHGDRLVAVWTRPGTSAWGTGPLATAFSADGGKTWTAGPNPADDGSTDGHGYADLLADAEGTFHLVWLDGRDGGQGLRGARSRDGGRTWSANATLDGRTCECCWNRLAARDSATMAVVYRDTEPRDLAVAASDDGGRTWTRRGAAGAFGWQFEGCPHVGGGIAYGAGALHVLSWTGAEGHEGMHVVTSVDGGGQWTSPVRLGAKTAHRGDLASSGATLAAVWDDPVAAKGAILAATSTDGGRTWSKPRRLNPAPGTASQPIVASLGGGRFLAAWTEKAPGGRMRWKSLAFGGGGAPARAAD
jgi:hypothetical protein